MYLDYTSHADLSRVPRADGGGGGGGRVPSGSKRPSLTATRSISPFRPESRRRKPDAHTHTTQLQRPHPAFLFRLILASPIELRQRLHSSRCGVAVETVAFPRPSDYCHLITSWHTTSSERPVFRRVGRERERRSSATGTWKHLRPLFLFSQISRSSSLTALDDCFRVLLSGHSGRIPALASFHHAMQLGTWSLASRRASRLLVLSTRRPHSLLWIS